MQIAHRTKRIFSNPRMTKTDLRLFLDAPIAPESRYAQQCEQDTSGFGTHMKKLVTAIGKQHGASRATENQ
jgi:hypothetical protein